MKYKTIDELKIRNGGVIRDGYNEELDEISLKAAHLKKEIQELKKDIYKKLNE